MEAGAMNHPKFDPEFKGLLDDLLFQLRSGLMVTVGFCDLAKEKLEPTNSAYPDVAKALQQAQQAQKEVWKFGQYWRQHREDPV
jgi:hypothetical protein